MQRKIIYYYLAKQAIDKKTGRNHTDFRPDNLIILDLQITLKYANK